MKNRSGGSRRTDSRTLLVRITAGVCAALIALSALFFIFFS